MAAARGQAAAPERRCTEEDYAGPDEDVGQVVRQKRPDRPPLAGLDEALPRLGPEHQPVLTVLRRGLDLESRDLAGRWLTELVARYDQMDAEMNMASLRVMLGRQIPKPLRGILDLVMGELQSEQPVRRAKMALGLILDGELPQLLPLLQEALRSGRLEPGAQRAVAAAVQIIEWQRQAEREDDPRWEGSA
jgi:hypothetical protein